MVNDDDALKRVLAEGESVSRLQAEVARLTTELAVAEKRIEDDIAAWNKLDAENQRLTAELAAARAPYMKSCPWCFVDLSQECLSGQFIHLVSCGDTEREAHAATKAALATAEVKLAELETVGCGKRGAWQKREG